MVISLDSNILQRLEDIFEVKREQFCYVNFSSNATLSNECIYVELDTLYRNTYNVLSHGHAICIMYQECSLCTYRSYIYRPIYIERTCRF